MDIWKLLLRYVPDLNCRSVALLLLFVSCSKESTKNGDALIPSIAPAICDYEQKEVEMKATGWLKVFEDNFESDLSQWNVWTGGAYNEELQHYQASNLEVANGTLLINAKKESVTGNTRLRIRRKNLLVLPRDELKAKQIYLQIRMLPKSELQRE